MDPDATLAAIRQELAILADSDTPVDDRLESAERLAEFVEALDGWLTRKGFLPAAWSRVSLIKSAK